MGFYSVTKIEKSTLFEKGNLSPFFGLNSLNCHTAGVKRNSPTRLMQVSSMRSMGSSETGIFLQFTILYTFFHSF